MLHDLRVACRALRTARAYAAWVIGSLAVGMTATIAALALLNAVLLQAFAGVTDQTRLARVTLQRACDGVDCWSRLTSAADYETARAGLAAGGDLAAYALDDVALAATGVYGTSSYLVAMRSRELAIPIVPALRASAVDPVEPLKDA